MANRTASLLRYAKPEGLGWRRETIPTSKNDRPRLDVMIHNGKEYSIPADSHFQIRHGKFNSMTPAEQVAQFGGEAPLAKQFLASQARKELVGNIGKGAGIAAIAHVTGLDRPLLHMLMH